MSVTTGQVVRRTFTLTELEADLLDKITKHRHPTDRRVDSLTVRELIREEYERVKQAQRRGRHAHAERQR